MQWWERRGGEVVAAQLFMEGAAMAWTNQTTPVTTAIRA